MAEEKICGTDVAKIRKAYFQGKLPKLLTDIQATGEYGIEDFKRLESFLEGLKEQDKKLSTNFSSFLPQLDEVYGDSVLDELNKESLSEAEMAELDREQENRAAAVNFASKMLKRLFVQFHSTKEQNPSEEELMNMSFEMLGLQYYLIRDALYKERLFRKKIVEYERAGKQRKSAEELAKTTLSYREYALADGLRELATEFTNLAKKRYKNL